ncbi:MAG: hypothetical protein EZS28_008311 [Streblomastix strix]|uniref:SPRY domain-containing protein n=1 Tax=Streblomastix strix TaxID=222440 RepID=A0A5J4WMF0_9EUKA|nr:MAG: hypothetical protein EZS28_008311 [Streblomastix strix]
MIKREPTTITPILILPPNVKGVAQANKFIHSAGNYNGCTIACDPIIWQGIVKFEVIFENTAQYDKRIGIADASCLFDADEEPQIAENQNNTVRYWFNGILDHITDGPKNNQCFKDNQKVTAEIDMISNPKKLTFFVDDVEQINRVINIPPQIRFWVFISNPSSSFTITKFEHCFESSAKGVKDSKNWEWGKIW